MPPKAKAPKVPGRDAIPTSMAALRAQLEARYGTARVVRREEVLEYSIISTGSIGLDYATRVGGWVQGRTHEIIGVEGVGKTTLAIMSMIEAQRAFPDQAVGYIDMEQTFDYEWAESLGLDTSDDRWLHMYPDDSEDVSDQLRMQCRTDLFSMIVVDSIGGMESKQALSKEAEEVTMGRNAQVITRMVKNVAVLARKHQVAILFINQFRANLSGMGSDVSAGPKALRYNTTMKVEMRRASGEATTVTMKFEDEKDAVVVGVQVKAKVVRNKVSAPGYSTDFWIFNHDTDEYGPVGIDRADEALSLGIRTGVVPQKGAYYVLPDGKQYQGRAKTMEVLRGELDLVDEIRQRALATVSGEIIPTVEVKFDDEESTDA